MMQRHAMVFLLVLPAALLLHAKNKKPASLPAVFGQARSVYVEATDGKEFDPNLDAADRMAIADVRDALAHWKRYAPAASRQEADLVIVVRKGRAESGVASGNAGLTPRPGQMPSGANRQGGFGSTDEMAVDTGASEDLLEACTVNGNGKLSAPLWQQSMPNGLNAPDVFLLKQFEEAVDKAYPPQPATQNQPGQHLP
jgi:hypothetical protein